jgi:hypothetical protein
MQIANCNGHPAQPEHALVCVPGQANVGTVQPT